MRRHLYYYTLLDAPHESAAELFRGDPSRWLPFPARPSGTAFAVELSADGALPRQVARHQALVEVGPASDEGGRLLRSVVWRSATAPGIFPVFDGDVELIELQQGVCQLSLIGTYRPPLSVAGGVGDRVLGHHVAEACARRFVLDAAERMVTVTLPV